jgi:hypothetical protein
VSLNSPTLAGLVYFAFLVSHHWFAVALLSPPRARKPPWIVVILWVGAAGVRATRLDDDRYPPLDLRYLSTVARI